MRIAFVLPGLHRVVRGAEVAFESIAEKLAHKNGVEVTLFGSGTAQSEGEYSFIHVRNQDRQRFERWPQIPIFRNEYVYEEFTFAWNLWGRYRPQDFDIAVTCSYPFINWFLNFKGGKRRPAQVFVTQNGDYPAISNQSEYRFFACEGLVCTNPDYFERNRDRWFSTLIPNGVNPQQFFPGQGDRLALQLPADVPIALMVSALIEEKRVVEGIQAAAQVPDLHLVVCGDGPERDRVQSLGNTLMPGRFELRKMPRSQMPDLYRSVNLLLHMSLNEPSANAYMEALATGLPIVTHDRLVTQWTIENTGILIDATDPQQVVEGLYRALDAQEPEDVMARRLLIEKRFTWQALADQYYYFFHQVLNQRSQIKG